MGFALPHKSPWWGESIALQGGMGTAKKNRQQRSCSCSKTVACNDQLILLQTHTQITIPDMLASGLPGNDTGYVNSQVRCWMPGSKYHHWLVSCRCSLQLEICPVMQTFNPLVKQNRYAHIDFSVTYITVFTVFYHTFDFGWGFLYLMSIAGSWHTFNSEILTFSGEVCQHILQKHAKKSIWIYLS